MDNFDGYIADLYRQIELELISSMKRNLALHLAEEEKTGIKYPQWQAMKLKELKRFQRENADIIGRKTKGLTKEVSEHMQKELKEGSAHEFKTYREALGKGYKSAKAVNDSFFKVDNEKVKGMINALNNDLSTANSAMFRMANDTYRQVIYKYSFFMVNGAYTYKKAYDAATKDFLERGINCIEYKDGRRVNIADYCRMAVRTSSQRAYMTGQGEVRKKIGNPLIIITKHNTSCKLCKPFERQVLIDDVYSGGTKEDGNYMLLSEAMKEGLYHPSCRHGSDTYYREREEFFEEYYKTHKEPETTVNEGKENNEVHIDNMVQKYKRLVTGSVDEDNISKYQILLDEWRDKKADFVDNSSESGIINTGSDSMVISSIDKPIEQRNTGKGNPNAILLFDVALNQRQEKLLTMLPDFNSRTIVPKSSVKMSDLSALTAKTGVEYAMFTKEGERLIIRGNEYMVDISVEQAQTLKNEGYKWSGHTHPGLDFLSMQPSDGDYAVLNCFEQDNAVIYNSKGDFRIFEKRS